MEEYFDLVIESLPPDKVWIQNGGILPGSLVSLVPEISISRYQHQVGVILGIVSVVNEFMPRFIVFWTGQNIDQSITLMEEKHLVHVARGGTS